MSAARYLSVRECAELLAVDHKTVRRLIEAGTLPALRVGRAIRIAPDDLRALAIRPPSSATGTRLRTVEPRSEFARLARTANVQRNGHTAKGDE